MTSRIHFLLAALASAALACDPQAGGGGSVIPGEDPTSTDIRSDGPAGGQSPEELAARMRDLVDMQRAMISAADEDSGKCEDLCSLATSICGTKEKLCRIADERAGEPSYQNLCREAVQQCNEAQESCQRCVENHMNTTRANADAPKPGAASSAPEGEPDAEAAGDPGPARLH